MLLGCLLLTCHLRLEYLGITGYALPHGFKSECIVWVTGSDLAEDIHGSDSDNELQTNTRIIEEASMMVRNCSTLSKRLDQLYDAFDTAGKLVGNVDNSMVLTRASLETIFGVLGKEFGLTGNELPSLHHCCPNGLSVSSL